MKKEAFEERDHDGITPELLDCIVREASLREMGRPDQADSVRKEALRARLACLGWLPQARCGPLSSEGLPVNSAGRLVPV